MQSFTTGTIAGDGSFHCQECGTVGPLARTADVPACPQCGSTRVVRASLFSARFQREGEGAGVEAPREELVAAAQEFVPSPGRYLAFQDGAELRVVAIEGEHLRIGRSLTADLRFDDPTVSRRHALIVRQDDGESLRVVDDRSLNGVFVNGERVEWRVLRHGDEVVVGRHRLVFLDTISQAPGTAEHRTPGLAAG